MHEKILIFGNGQIGNLLLNYFKNKQVEAFLTKCDITDDEQVDIALKAFNPSVVINTAALTNLEECDKNMLKAYDVNTLSAFNLARACARANIYFVHFSSGCIFESRDEFDLKKETDVANPSSYYAFTKAWADQLITKYVKDDLKYLIVRPRQPISGEVHHKNMLLKLLTFTSFIDTPNTLTYIDDLLVWLDKLIHMRYVGIVNVANKNYTTPARLARMLSDELLPELEVNIISKTKLDSTTPVRRVDAVLDVSLLESLVGKVRNCDEVAKEAVLKLKENFANEAPFTINDELRKTAEQTKTRTTVNKVYKKLCRED